MGEKIYECEVKKLFRPDGSNVGLWVTMPLAEALREGATAFRCQDCHGAVRLHGKHTTR
jgi:hypothetical protein